MDCVNTKHSQLKKHNSLFDNHLHPYLKSYVNRRELQMKGFINEKGHIMYDTLYRDILRNINKLKEEITEKKLMKYI